MTKLIDDLSVLTNIPENVLKKLSNVSELLIGNAVYEALCKNKQEFTIDLGFGDLNIFVSSDSVKYKFVPSDSLEKEIVKVICNKSSPIVVKLDNNLKDKIDKSYKELL